MLEHMQYMNLSFQPWRSRIDLLLNQEPAICFAFDYMYSKITSTDSVESRRTFVQSTHMAEEMLDIVAADGRRSSFG